MILKGRPRADGGKLAAYLLSEKNERVRVLEVRGTIMDEASPEGLRQSLGDMDELGKMTRAKSSLFHLAINPSDRDRMTPEGWRTSIEKAEKALGLEEQPRAIVSHVYEGKEHLHVVWSRVDVEERKCVELSFSHRKLCQAAREIEIELGLQQTPSQARGQHRLKQSVRDIQSQQEARTETPREQLDASVSRAWHGAGSAEEFKRQIEAEGLQLARGRRGVLVMDGAHETYAIPRCVEGVKTKEVRDRLDGLEGLPTVEEVRASQTKTRGTQGQQGREVPQPQEQEQPSETPAMKPTTQDTEPTERAQEEERKADLLRRQAALGQAGDLRAALTPSATQGTPPDDETTKLIPRGAKNLTAPQSERALTASNDNAPPDQQKEKQKPQYTPFKGESEEQFAARVTRLEERAKREAERQKEVPKLEPHLRPKDRGYSY